MGVGEGLEIFLRPDQSRSLISFFAVCFALLFLTFCYVVNFFHDLTDSVTEILFDVLKQISLLLDFLPGTPPLRFSFEKPDF